MIGLTLKVEIKTMGSKTKTTMMMLSVRATVRMTSSVLVMPRSAPVADQPHLHQYHLPVVVAAVAAAAAEVVVAARLHQSLLQGIAVGVAVVAPRLRPLLAAVVVEVLLHPLHGSLREKRLKQSRFRTSPT